MKRFSLHLLITAALAPALGVAASTIFGAFDHGRFHPEQGFTALSGGLISLAFIWFITLPVGLLSYAACGFVARRRLGGAWLWPLVCSGLGLAFGLAMGRWSAALGQVTGSVGAVIGLVTGLVLYRLWNRELGSAPAH